MQDSRFIISAGAFMKASHPHEYNKCSKGEWPDIQRLQEMEFSTYFASLFELSSFELYSSYPQSFPYK
jgi:hypothetical protein